MGEIPYFHRNKQSGWWYTYPFEEYEFVNGKDYPIYYGKII
jgi:hypothetical protein